MGLGLGPQAGISRRGREEKRRKRLLSCRWIMNVGPEVWPVRVGTVQVEHGKGISGLLTGKQTKQHKGLISAQL